jgi:hypothetical protein
MVDTTTTPGAISFDLNDFAAEMNAVNMAARRTMSAADKQNQLNVAAAERTRQLAGGYSAIVQEESARQAALLKQQMALPIEAGGQGGGGRQNPLDLLSSTAAAILDPANFTAEGLKRQLAMSETRVQMAGTIHNAETNRVAADAALETARLGADSTALEMSLNNMKAQVEARQTFVAGAQTNEVARQAKISSLDAGQLNQILTTAKTGEAGGKIELEGGFAATRQELLLRQRDLKQQALLLSIPVEATSPEAQNHAVLLMGSMSHADLLKVRENGNMLPNGYKVATDVLDAEIQAKALHDVEKVVASSNELVVQKTQARIAGLVKRNEAVAVSPSHPLYGASKRLEAQAAGYQVLYDQAIKLGTPGAIQAAVVAGQEIEVAWNAEVESVAKARAGVDKALVPILTAQLKGEQVDPSQVLDYVANRAAEGMSFTRAFQDQKLATDLQMGIEKEISTMLLDNMGSTRKEVAPMAAQKVLEKFVSESASATVAGMFTDAMFRADNPLRIAGLQPIAWSSLNSLAGSTAEQYIVAEHGLNPDQAAIIFDTKRIDNEEIAKLTGLEASKVEAIRAENNQAYLAALVTQIDAATAGKTSGRAYVDWLSQNWQTIAEQTNTNKNGVNAFMTLDSSLGQAGTTIQMLQQAVEQADGMGQKIISDFYTQHNNPRLMFTSAINGVESLTEDQRFSVNNRVIIPTLDMAEKQKLDAEQTTALVMAAMTGQVPEIQADPATKDAASAAAKQLPQVISATRSVLRAMENGIPADKPRRQAMLESLNVLRTGAMPTAEQVKWAEVSVNQVDMDWWEKLTNPGATTLPGTGFASTPGSAAAQGVIAANKFSSENMLSQPGAVEALQASIAKSLEGMK